MQILRRAFGRAVTNCYVVKNGDESIVIDPGEGAFEWANEMSVGLKGVFLTHGHYDHVYDTKFFMEAGFKSYIHESDAFFCENDPFGIMPNSFEPSVLAKNGDEFVVGSFCVKFHHFPGHTPGCCMLEVGRGDEMVMFGGDFLFQGSVGRWDFAFSDANLMRESLKRALNLKGDFKIYPGHGMATTLSAERATIEYFLRVV